MKNSLPYGETSKMSLKREQKDVTQRQKEHEYSLPNLKRKTQRKIKTGALKQMKSSKRATSILISYCLKTFFMHLCLKRPKETLTNLIDSHIVALPCILQRIFSE